MERVRNMLTGETMTFTRLDGQMLEFDVELRPFGVPGGAPHRHGPTEILEVHSGTILSFIAGREPRPAHRGDTVEIPGGRWHMLLALTRARAHVWVKPAMRFHDLLACSAAVCNGDVRPSTLRRLNELLHEHDCHPRLPLDRAPTTA
jgi:hypothetical protein